jgi:UDP-GlcNAc:undecaprenyl-phosphate GlcNAc-1-phosphate transferase
MGDAGSMVTGLVIGTLGIQSSLKAPATVALLVPVTILTVPFLDTFAAILRRKLTGRSIFATDRAHLHHCLQGRGLSPVAVLACVSLFCLLAGVGGLVSEVLKNDVIAVCTAVAVVAVLVATRLFGRAELSLVHKRLGRLTHSFLQTRGRGRFHRIDVHMHGTANWRLLLDSVIVRAFDLNLQTVRLEVSVPAIREEYHAQWDRFEEQLEETLWRIELPLVVGGRFVGRLLVTGYPDAEPLAAKAAALDRVVESFEFTAVREPVAVPHLSRPGWLEMVRPQGTTGERSSAE